MQGLLPLQDGTLTPPGWEMEGVLTSARIAALGELLLDDDEGL